MRRAALLFLAGCAAADPPPSTGGVDVAVGPCGRGLVVVESDYQSTNVAIFGQQGEPLSPSFISSAGASAALSAPLSGDVVLPSVPIDGPEVVLVDRYPASVLTWVELVSATPRAQLDVSTGFAANPQDYLEIAPDKAYVSRFETNPNPGAEAHDAGGDVLVVDPSAPAIRGRIDLAGAVDPGFLPRANRMARKGDAVFVLLSAYSADFSDSLPSRVVRIDAASDAITGVTVLEGAHGCVALALEPGGDERLAVSCAGKFGGTATPTLAESALVLLSSDDPPVELERHPATMQPFGFGLAFAPDGAVLVNTLGSFDSDQPDTLLRVDAAGTSEVLRSALPFELGDVSCGPAGGCACFVADAGAGVVHRLSPDARSLDVSLTSDDGIGLPPRFLGRF